MITLWWLPNKLVKQIIVAENENSFNQINVSWLEEKLKMLIIRDLLRLKWTISFENEKITISPPNTYEKDDIKRGMSYKKEEIILKNKSWIEKNLPFAIENLANGYEVLNSPIIPVLEVCDNENANKLFKLFRYYW